MKYGVIVFKESNNIGDDIQSYAAMKLLPQVDYYIEREHLDVFRPKEAEPVNAIINGWLMYNKLGWPISPCINPLYISMHFQENDILGIKNGFLQGLGSDDLKEHEPIGCRDRETQLFLEKEGIATWFSGCVTLTLRCNAERKRENYICLVDVSDEVEHFIRKKYPEIEIKIIHHVDETNMMKSKSWKERFANVEKILTLYQNAQAVVTTRLHCAMPCLGLETPVLLLSEEDIEEQNRFDGLASLTYHTSTEILLQGNSLYDFSNPPENPKAYYEIRKKIMDKVEEFIKENSVYTTELKSRFDSYDKEWEKRALWKDKCLNEVIHQAMISHEKEHNYLLELQSGKDWLEDQYNNLQKEINNLKNINEVVNQDKLRVENEKEKIVEKNKELFEQCRELHTQAEHLREQIFELDNLNSELSIYKSILEQRNITLKEDNIKISTENEQNKKQNDIYYNNIINMKNSISWKIGWAVTALPRMFVRLIGKK